MERARVIISGAATIISAAFVLAAAIPFAVPIIVVISINVVGAAVFLKLTPLVAYSLMGLLVVSTVTLPIVAIAISIAIAF